MLIKALCIWSLPDFCQPALAIWAKLGPGELQSLQLRKWRQMRRPQRTKQNLLVVCKSQEHVQCLRQGGRDRCGKACRPSFEIEYWAVISLEVVFSELGLILTVAIHSCPCPYSCTPWCFLCPLESVVLTAAMPFPN